MKENKTNLDELPAVAKNIIERLKRDLPVSLTYHSAVHTVEVVEEVLLYCKEDRLTKRDEKILAISAAFHDAGFLYKRGQNEDLAAKLAEMEMQKDGNYSVDEINDVMNCIISTKIGKDFTRTPKSELAKYLMDADLGNLGRVDFLAQNELIIQEMGFDRNDFLRRSFVLLEKHDWYTKAAKTLRSKGKTENKSKLVKLISELEG